MKCWDKALPIPLPELFCQDIYYTVYTLALWRPGTNLKHYLASGQLTVWSSCEAVFRVQCKINAMMKVKGNGCWVQMVWSSVGVRSSQSGTRYNNNPSGEIVSWFSQNMCDRVRPRISCDLPAKKKKKCAVWRCEPRRKRGNMKWFIQCWGLLMARLWEVSLQSAHWTSSSKDAHSWCPSCAALYCAMH